MRKGTVAFLIVTRAKAAFLSSEVGKVHAALEHRPLPLFQAAYVRQHGFSLSKVQEQEHGHPLRFLIPAMATLEAWGQNSGSSQVTV